MATSKDFLDYLKEQLREIPEVTYRPMMGEYLIYYRDKLLGDICDNRLLLKPVNAAKEMLPSVEMQPPYKGAKPMIVVDDFEDVEFMRELFDAVYSELPAPKKKTKKADY